MNDSLDTFSVLSRTAASWVDSMQHLRQKLDYRGYQVEVSVEAEPLRRAASPADGQIGFVAIVRVCRAATQVAVFSPLRFGARRGEPFVSAHDAAMGGFAVGYRMIDDLIVSTSV